MIKKEIKQKLGNIDEKIKQFEKKEEQLKVLTALCNQDEVRDEQEIKGYYKEAGKLFKDNKDPVYKILKYAKEIFDKDKNAANTAITNGIQRSRDLKELEKNILGKNIEKDIQEILPNLSEDSLEIIRNKNEFLHTFRQSLQRDMDSINEQRRLSEQFGSPQENTKDVQTIGEYLNEMERKITVGKQQMEDMEIEKNMNSTIQQFGDTKSERGKNERRRSSGLSFMSSENRHLRKERRISELGDEAEKLIPMLLDKASEKVQEGRIQMLEDITEMKQSQEIHPNKQILNEKEKTQSIIAGIEQNLKENNQKMPTYEFDENGKNISKGNVRTRDASKDILEK